MEEQEKKKRIVIKMIRETEELVLEINDSVDPDSTAGHSLKGLKPFLEQMQQEVTEKFPEETRDAIRKTLATKVADFFLAILLKPFEKLLRELWAKAALVISQVLGGN